MTFQFYFNNNFSVLPPVSVWWAHHNSLVPQDVLHRFIPVWVLTMHVSEATRGQKSLLETTSTTQEQPNTELGLPTSHRPYKTRSSFSYYWLLGPVKWLQWIHEFPQVILACLILHFCTFYPAEVSLTCGKEILFFGGRTTLQPKLIWIITRLTTRGRSISISKLGKHPPLSSKTKGVRAQLCPWGAELPWVRFLPSSMSGGSPPTKTLRE